MIVLKFGGSSVASATAMSRVLDIVEEASSKDKVVLVCSAISGCTDALLQIGKSEDPEHLIESLEGRHISIINRLFTGKERGDAIAECRSVFSDVRCIPPVIEAFGEVLSTNIIAKLLRGRKDPLAGFPRTRDHGSRKRIRGRSGGQSKDLRRHT